LAKPELDPRSTGPGGNANRPTTAH
jgi:hypothetical protein